MIADVLPHVRTAAFDRVLTYIVPEGMAAGVGDVVRVPLGGRDVYGYVVSPLRPYGAELDGLRPLKGRISAPRAFDETGLAIARWIAEHYCCSLAEALGAVVLAGAVPRVVERLVPIDAPNLARYTSVPPRLARFIWNEFPDGFALEHLLRHPEARRCGDRRTLLRAITALVRGGALVRKRTFEGARIGEARERVLEAADGGGGGPRMAALVRLVRDSGELRRADALLAGFSTAVIARAVRAGVVRERERPTALATMPSPRPPASDLVATPQQRSAIDAIVSATSGGFREFLLQGVTGSGKTFVYTSAIAHIVANAGQAIVLVPEISLTPQTARRFEAAFGSRVAVLHSALSERERYDAWQAAAHGDKDVVVGARSAVFAPLPNARMIVVDEAHEATYKQDSTPRYNAVDVARERMREAQGVVVLGSATPPLEAYFAAAAGAVTRIVLAERATALPLPDVHVVDMAEEFAGGNRRMFSTALVDAVEQRLARREKIVLFVNRRGSASFALCRSCGFVPECARCSLSLTVHRAEMLLRCHLCDGQEPLPPACPRCRGPMREFGIGTQRVAEFVRSLFPGAHVVRMDGDTTTRVGDHARLLDEFAEHGDVLVGTQMVAKGLDFPTVTLVGVVAADVGLHLPDFRAGERTFDLLTQVAGRSGRALPGDAIVQTYSPQHPAIQFAARHDYEGFARWELAQRRPLRYPPFARLIYLGVIGRHTADVVTAAQRYGDALRARDDVEVLGPAPYPVPRVNDEWRYRIAVKTDDDAPVRAFIRETLQPLARAERTTRLVVNVDP